MKNTNKNQLELAADEGYTEQFLIHEGHLHCVSQSEISYPLSSILPGPRLCMPTRTIVYRVCTPDGRKGTISFDFEHAENEF